MTKRRHVLPPDFAEIASALATVAGDHAGIAALAEQFAAGVKFPAPGVHAEAAALRRRAEALGRAHAIVTALVRYEPEVLRLVALAQRNAGRPRRRWFNREKHHDRQPRMA
ncbi:MAG: hypothetical protein AB7U62_19910 [Pseudolabrys sp.]